MNPSCANSSQRGQSTCARLHYYVGVSLALFCVACLASLKAVDGTGHTPVIYGTSDEIRSLVMRQVERGRAQQRGVHIAAGLLDTHVAKIAEHQQANADLERGEKDIGHKSREYQPTKPVSDFKVSSHESG